MTFNMANYDDHGNWPARIGLFVNLIVQNQPDVILLQEVRFNPDQPTTKVNYQNMAEQVLAALQARDQYRGAFHVHTPVEQIPLAPENQGYNVTSPAALSPTRNTIEWEGLSIISRVWIKETGCLWLTAPDKIDGDRNTRGTQYAAIDLNHGVGAPLLLYLFNTHFAYTELDALQNVQDTINFIKRFETISNGNYLLAGDFNMEPGSGPINLLYQSPDFVDMWFRIWGTQAPGLTFPASRPIKRIDYVFVSPAISKGALSITTCGNIPDSTGVYASDHLGLIASFSIKAPSSKSVVLDNMDEILNGFVLV